MLEDMFTRLAEPFPVEQITWRVGNTNIDKQTGKPRDGNVAKGMALAYIDARDVMDRLDLVCGPDGWQCRYSHVGPTTVCELSIRCEGEWLTKADGAGATDYEPEKGSLSDSFKRSAVRWAIGRYLYGLSSPWVEIVARGRTWIIKESEYSKLNSLLRTHMGVTAKSAAEAVRHKDFDFYAAKVGEASDLEALGAVGREIKENIHRLPAAMRDPLHDYYAETRERLQEAASGDFDPARDRGVPLDGSDSVQ